MDVLVDTDFFTNLTNIEKDPDLFLNVMDDLEATPHVHQYVADNELFENKVFKKYKEQNIIKVITYSEFLNMDDEVDKEYYRLEFERLYKSINGSDSLPEDIFSFRKAKSNIGEIHSTILAQNINITIFFSNDNGAREMIKTHINTSSYTLSVKNIKMVFTEVAMKKEKKTKWNSAKIALKQVNISQDEIEKISKLWHQENCNLCTV